MSDKPSKQVVEARGCPIVDDPRIRNYRDASVTFHTGGFVDAKDCEVFELGDMTIGPVKEIHDTDGWLVDIADPKPVHDMTAAKYVRDWAARDSEPSTLVDFLYHRGAFVPPGPEPWAGVDIEHRPGFHPWRAWFGRGWSFRWEDTSAPCGSWWHRRPVWGSLSVLLGCQFMQTQKQDDDTVAIRGRAREYRPGRSFGFFTVLGPAWPGSNIEGIDDGT